MDKTNFESPGWNDDGPGLDFLTSSLSQSDDGQDEKLLNTLGKKQDVKRVHNLASLIGLTTCAMSTWIGVLYVPCGTF